MFSSAIVWYLFLAGAGTGAYLVAVATMFGYHQKNHKKVARPYAKSHTGSHFNFSEPQQSSFFTSSSHFGIEQRQGLNPSSNHIRVSSSLAFSAIMMIAGSLSLLATLKNPFNVWKILFIPFASITSFGATALVVFTVLAVLTTIIVLCRFRLPHWIFATLLTLGAIAALCTMLYTGFLLILIVPVDFWSTWLVPLLFVISSLTCGLAASLFIEALYLGIRSSGFMFRWNTLFFFSLAETVAFLALLTVQSGYSSTALESVQSLLFGSETWPFWLGVVILGIVLPLGLHFLFPRLPLEALVLVACAGILVGGFFIRYCIVNAGLMTPILPFR